MSNLLISRVVEYNVSGTIPYFIYQYKQSLSPKIGPRLYLLRILITISDYLRSHVSNLYSKSV